ncbi:GNAT family N-acetyltransferase [Paucihalobacter ruber]|uniref:GNAT family N-acetyltransferase n=1 Tax=Paucihalobacter ruber TaxID=2567861 RepID=A0A506PD73_9FLAO|nr:GNAT family N-acetyltransferase [Paucihalobacter ruber]TPV31484.1 GNAT family N-acetyltransferase [Paucihalobacter ruber]
MDAELVQLKSNEHLFFNILPIEWQDNIVPFWNDYKSSSKVIVFYDGDDVIAGGILFSAMPPDLKLHSTELQTWFDKGYLYIGFLWVAEHKRNQKMGSLWIEKIKDLMPKQKFWLVIEEEDLGKFYEKHHFIKEQTIVNEDTIEWVYAFKPNV